MAKVITANVLSTGAVVFFGRDRRWVRHLGEALSFVDEAAAAGDLDRAREDADRALIVDPFLTDLTPGADGVSAMSLRDRIRAYGPTIAFLPTDESGPRGP